MSTFNTTAHQQRLVADQILDRIAGDPAFHQQLLNNPTQALQGAGFTPALEAGEVMGYDAPGTVCKGTCGYRSCRFTCLITCFPSTCKSNTCANNTCASSAKQ